MKKNIFLSAACFPNWLFSAKLHFTEQRCLLLICSALNHIVASYIVFNFISLHCTNGHARIQYVNSLVPIQARFIRNSK